MTAIQAGRDRAPDTGAALGGGALVDRVGQALKAAGVRYCQWKGYGKLARIREGRSDLDLLVDRTEAGTFEMVLHQMGFKTAVAPAHRQVPGVISYMGLDDERGCLIHVHAHFRLIVGRQWGRYFRLPIERQVLASTVAAEPFPVPSPEFRVLLLVLGATLRHGIRELARNADPEWLLAIRRDLELLAHETPMASARSLALHLLPEVGARCFLACLRALGAGYLPWRRLRTRYRLEWRLRGDAEVAGTARLSGAMRALRSRLVRREPESGLRPLSGGALIALVGADGAGKSTCAQALRAWLGSQLHTCHAHLGRPPRSWWTLAVGGALKVARRLGRSGHLELLRALCLARDRYRLFRRAQRIAASGGLVLCERYPVIENWALAGPSAASSNGGRVHTRLAARLRGWELSYYQRIRRPDLIVVLQVDPETAVRRKVDEPEGYVRQRAQTVWGTDWNGSGAFVVDARRRLDQVMAELRGIVWRAL